MTSFPFKEKVLDLLSATGYSLNLKPDQLSSLEQDKELKPFFDWFNLNISEENCLTSEELEEFKELEKNGEVLFGEELDQAIQSYHKHPVDLLLPCAESSKEIICDEVDYIKEQLRLKEDLHTVLKSSISAVSEDILELQKESCRTEAQKTHVLKDIVAENKKLIGKLQEVKEVLDNFRDTLSGLDHGSEISTDEGIDTYISDKPNCSTASLVRTQSMQSICSEKQSDSKYLFEVPFHKYERNQKQFCRLLDGLLQKGLSMIDKNQETDMDVELELLNIMDRLSSQKQSYLKNLAKLEGIKDAQNKINEVYKELKNESWKPTHSELRSRLIDFEESSVDLEESFDRDACDLANSCEKWAELHTLQPVHDRLQQKMAHSEFVMRKMDEITEILKLKSVADGALCNMLEWEKEKVHASIETYLSMQETVRKWLDSTRKRLDVISVNVQDYANHCALPVEERSKLVQWLATILGSDTNAVPQTVLNMTEDVQKQHELLADHCNQHMQALISTEHKMRDFYYKEVHEQNKAKAEHNPEMFLNIQKTIDEMSNEILNIIDLFSLEQEKGGGLEEGDEVQDMLKKLSQYNKN